MLNIGLGLLEQVGEIAERAGHEIMTIYVEGFEIERKDDHSPVTEADRRAEALIIRAITEQITRDIPIIGEESVAATPPTLGEQPFWLVDPLDGTKEFIDKRDEFTVNIAIVENRRPVLGVVHLPARKETFYGANLGAFKKTGDGPMEPIAAREALAAGLTAVVSRLHSNPAVDEYLGHYPVAEKIDAGSSLKFCRIAEGSADIYPRFGRTMEWDTAAGHAVLRFAGGRVVTTDGADLTYGKAGLENPHFIALGKGIEPVVA